METHTEAIETTLIPPVNIIYDCLGEKEKGKLDGRSFSIKQWCDRQNEKRREKMRYNAETCLKNSNFKVCAE